jgi:hypothetical protein
MANDAMSAGDPKLYLSMWSRRDPAFPAASVAVLLCCAVRRSACNAADVMIILSGRHFDNRTV